MAVIGTERGIVNEGARGTTTETATGTAPEDVMKGTKTKSEDDVITPIIVKESEAETPRAKIGQGAGQVGGATVQQTRPINATETGDTAIPRAEADATTRTESSARAQRDKARRATAIESRHQRSDGP